MTTLSTEVREQLISLAKEAFTKSYSPYSKFKVGAAIMTEDGEIFTGCNIENLSYGLTCCGERTAAYKMVSEKGPQARIRFIAVATEADIACTPCGMCRQVIQEFGPNAIVIHKSEEGYVERTIQELLPAGFSELVATEDDGTQTLIQLGA